jgi:hypothetical protein
MTKLVTLKIFAAAAVLSAVGAVAGSSGAAGDKTLSLLAGYRGWSRVTPEPLRSEESFAGG